MVSNPLKQQVSFINELEKLKTVLRANRTLDGRFENTAEHSWHVAVMGLVLQPHAQCELDMAKVTKLLLLHDVVEIDAGDTWLFAEDQSSKRANESAAANRIFGLLPQEQALEFSDLWCEFENRSSEEAKFAAAIDAISPLLNHLLTGRSDEGVIPAETVRQKKAFISACVPSLWPLVERLIEESTSSGLYV